MPGASDDVVFDGSSGGGTITLNYNPTILSITMGAFTGTFNDGAHNPSMGTFSCSGTGTRTLTMSGSWTITGSNATTWDASTATNLTVTPAGSTVTLSGTSVTIAGNKTWGSFVFTGASTNASPHSQGTTMTFANFTITAPAGGVTVYQTSVMTVTSVLTLTGAARNDRLWFRSNAPTTTRTITVNGSVSLTNVDFQSIVSAGSAGTWTGTSLGDCGNNTTITTTSPVSRFWVAGTGNCSDSTNHWASTSGGSPAIGNYPLPQDTLVFDSNSFSGGGQTVTLDAMRVGSPSMTLATNSPTLTLSANQMFFGSLTLISAMTFNSASGVVFEPLGSATLTCAGKSWGANNISLNTPTSGTGLTLQDTFTQGASTNNVFTLTAGTLNTNGQTVTIGSLASNGSIARVLTLGSSTINVTRVSAVTIWNVAATGMTLNAGTSTIIINGTPTGIQTFAGAGLVYNNVTFSRSFGNFAMTITGSNTFNVLTFTGKNIYNFTNGTTQTVTQFVANGTPSNLVVLQSDSAGNAWTISDSSGYNSVNYVSLQDSTATGGATFNANLSTSVSGNTGWNFITAGYLTGISSITGLSAITL